MTALGTSATPTCHGSQPRPTSTAGTAISRANHAAGTAAAARALRTTTGLRITVDGQEAVRPAADPGRRRPGTPSTASAAPTTATDGAGRRRLHEQHHARRPWRPRERRRRGRGGRRCRGRASSATAAAASAAPSIGSAMTARQPSSPSMVPPASGPRQDTAAAMPATCPRATASAGPEKRALTMATPRVGTAAAPAPWTMRAPSRTPKLGARAPASAPMAIRLTPDEQRQAEPDEVGDPAVDRGRHREHQRVEADRPGADADADAEVGAQHRQHDRRRGAAEPGEPEEQADEDGNTSARHGGGRGGRRWRAEVIACVNHRERSRHSSWVGVGTAISRTSRVLRTANRFHSPGLCSM